MSGIQSENPLDQSIAWYRPIKVPESLGDMIRQHSKGARLTRTSYLAQRRSSPWIALWLTPRHTMTDLLKIAAPRAYAMVLILSMGWVWSIETASLAGVGLTHGLMAIVGLVVLGGAASGVLGMALMVALTTMMGRAFGGRGTALDLFKVLLWSNVPLCLVLLLELTQIALTGMNYFTVGDAVSGQAAALVMSFIKMGLIVFGWYLTVVGVAQAHRCSKVQAALITAATFLSMLVLAVVALAQALSFQLL
ncbi:YIP1 family protein [Larsenimonas salina]|uniref:YIP1 family protein n=1 Tax=Larsenimonas salina TaxID=1295565 RepID=UPI0032F08C25